MTNSNKSNSEDQQILPNGPAAAAVLAAGIGSIALSTFTIAADNISALRSWLNFYKPSGPLSGVSTTAVGIWLVVWVALDLRWRRSDLPLQRISIVSITLLLLSLLATFPPISDLF